MTARPGLHLTQAHPVRQHGCSKNRVFQATMDPKASFQLGQWTVDPAANRIIGPEGERRIHGRAMDVLLCLVANAGEVVSRGQFSEQVWRDSVVGDDALTWSISELRRCLGDSATDPSYIETIPKRGYRLIAPVAPIETGRNGSGTGAPSSRRAWTLLPIGLAAVGALLLWWILSPEPAVMHDRDPHAIAVLPLSAIPTGPGLPLAEGFHADIINQLAAIAGLRVTSATSTRRFTETALSTPEIAEQLGVAWIVEGAMQQLDDRFRVSVQLIDARVDRQYWSRTYEGMLTAGRLFTVQDEIIADIVASIEQAIALNADLPRRQQPTDEIEAYALKVQARLMKQFRTESSMQRAADLYEQAVARDPEYADAWAGWGNALFLLHYYGYKATPATLIAIRERTDRALAIDPTHPRALTLQALLAAFEDQDLPAALALLEQSIQHSSEGSGWLAWFYAVGGRLDEALAFARGQLLSNPYSPAALLTLGTLELMANNPDRTLELSDRAIELSPGYSAAWQQRGQSLLLLNRHEAARQALDRALELSDEDQRPLLLAWREATREAPESEAMDYILESDDHFARAVILRATGDDRAALEALAAIDWNDLTSIRVRFHPWFEPLRQWPGYEQVIESIDQRWGIRVAADASQEFDS